MFFKDIEGNNVVKRQLLRAIEDNRLSHAILLSGPEGNAKLQIALALATYLNCSDRHDGDACGVCPSCLQMKKLAHPELHFVFPISNSVRKFSREPSSDDFIEEWRDFVNKTNGLGTLNDWYDSIGVTSGQGIINAYDCNNIIHALNYTSCESKYKVMIVWMIDKLFYSAAPKLLKIIEEPPEDTLFILITENRDSILDTILSRTQTLKVPAFSNEEIKRILINKYGVTADNAVKISDIVDGNAALAVNIAQSSDNDSHFFDDFIQWMRICLVADMLKILPFVDEFSKRNREQILLFLRSSLSQLRQALFYNLTGKFLLPVSDNNMTAFTRFSRFVNTSNIDIFNEAINKTITYVERNGYIPVLMTNLTVGLCRAFKTISK